MLQVLIRGDGVAARCCARLLQRPDIDLKHAAIGRAQVPAVMIGNATQRLFRDVFETHHLFEGMTRVNRRVVAWGGAEPHEFEHLAIVTSESALLDRLGPAPTGAAAPAAPADWTIYASAPPPPASTQQPFGLRQALATPVTLKPTAARDACWIESIANGWLFLLPSGHGSGWLLSVGPAAGAPLGQSRLIAQQIHELTGVARPFPAHPRIGQPISGSGWLACGTGAMAFDPLCGDGSGNAIREAILAAAVIRASPASRPPAGILPYYSARLLAGFRRHLGVCAQYYATGGPGPWWSEQRKATEAGIAWCDRALASPPAVQFRLLGFDLERVDTT